VTIRAAALSALFVVLASPAFAQTRWGGRVRVDVNAGAQVNTTRLDESFSLFRNLEPEPITATLPKKTIPVLDFGAAVRLYRNLGAGFSVSNLSSTGDAEIVAKIGHPFFFDQPRTVTGQGAISHNEATLHAYAVYMIATRRVDVALEGGASYFRISQDLVSNVAFTEEYPYDTAAFTTATIVQVITSRVGYNVGGDVTWKLSRHWGVGGLVRFARARVPFSVSNVDAGEVDVGGLQTSGGLRVSF